MLSLIPRLPVGHIRARSLAKARTAPAAGVAGNALVFPANGASPATTLVAFRLTGANLQPAFPATYIWRVKPQQQTGYYTTFFWGQQDGNFGGNGYYGCHPYPQGGGSGTTHNWEISINTEDDIVDENSYSTVVTKDVWYTQAAIAREIAGNEFEVIFYWNLGAGSDRVISYNTTTSSNDYALSFASAPSPGFIVGDAPWAVGVERLNGSLGQIKIFSAVLDLADIVNEAASMNTIATAAGAAARWWFKPGFSSVDDLTDATTGKSAAWVNANKATLGEAL